MPKRLPELDKNVEELSKNTLEENAWHSLSVKRISSEADPMGCWVDIDTPITVQEVKECLERGEEKLVDTISWPSAPVLEQNKKELRQKHIQKIAFFVANKAKTPIEIDVGAPAFGCNPAHLVVDGNHRLAGAMIRGDKYIRARVSGDVRHAMDLTLWNPNQCEQELFRRFEEDERAAKHKATRKPR